MDLAKACYGPDAIGVRRLLVLVRQLPPGSPLHRATDPRGWSWTATDELLAVIAELVDLNNRLFIQANSRKSGNGPKPLQIRRPWEDEQRQEPRSQATAEEIRAFFKR